MSNSIRQGSVYSINGLGPSYNVFNCFLLCIAYFICVPTANSICFHSVLQQVGAIKTVFMPQMYNSSENGL